MVRFSSEQKLGQVRWRWNSVGCWIDDAKWFQPGEFANISDSFLRSLYKRLNGGWY
jgi:hypothetical protein